MQRRVLSFLVWLLGVWVCGGASAEAAPPRVVASIAPLGMIAAAVMGDVASPVVLLPPAQSPHHGALKPSQARALADADVVVWIGPNMEMGVDKALDARPAEWLRDRIFTVSELPGVALLPGRGLNEIGDGHGHDHDHDRAHKAEHDHNPGEAHDHHDGGDPHLWLSPDNAAAIAAALAERLASIDGERAAQYRANAKAFAASLEVLKSDLAARLQGARGKGFVVFHDAYQYFETPFGLTAVAALTLDPSRPIGGRHLQEVRDKVRAVGAVCIFADAQASPDSVGNLARQLGVKSATLDPLGFGLKPTAKAYSLLLQRLAESFRGCLEQ